MPFEYLTREDKGCEYSLSCLACPRHICKYDDITWLEQNEVRSLPYNDPIIRDARIKEYFLDGRTPIEIANRLGVTATTIYRTLKEVPEYQQQRQDKQDIRDQILQLLDNELTPIQIIDQLKISPSTVYQISLKRKKNAKHTVSL